MNIFHNSIKQILFIFSIVFSLSLLSTKETFAATSNNVAGRAWSANIGWISMNNCTDVLNASTCSGPDYGVNALNSGPGTMSGYAWSPNLGWITFNTTGTVGIDCPAGFPQCTPYIDWLNPNGDGSASLKGWARVCSYYKNGCSGDKAEVEALGGWDGWIALGDTQVGDTKIWGVTVNGGTMSGFAWGGDVIGWVSFSGITVGTAAAPSGTLTATSCQITAGNDRCSNSFSWTTQNLIAADTAISRNDGDPDYVPTAAEIAVGGGTKATTIPYGSTTFFLYHNSVELAQATATATCVAGTDWNNVTGKCQTVPVVSLYASKTSINVGESSVLTWESQNTTSCNGFGFSTGAGSPTDNMSPGVVVSPIVTTTYSISCTGPGGTALSDVTITVNGTSQPECSDGIDNTDPEDVLIDFPADPGCTSPADTSELDRRRPIFIEL